MAQHYKIGGRRADLYFAVMPGLPRIHIRHEQGNSEFAKLALSIINEKAVTRPAEEGTGIIANQR